MDRVDGSPVAMDVSCPTPVRVVVITRTVEKGPVSPELRLAKRELGGRGGTRRELMVDQVPGAFSFWCDKARWPLSP